MMWFFFSCWNEIKVVVVVGELYSQIPDIRASLNAPTVEHFLVSDSAGNIWTWRDVKLSSVCDSWEQMKIHWTSKSALKAWKCTVIRKQQFFSPRVCVCVWSTQLPRCPLPGLATAVGTPLLPRPRTVSTALRPPSPTAEWANHLHLPPLPPSPHPPPPPEPRLDPLHRPRPSGTATTPSPPPSPS